jgi:anti-sigma-K factor RskA
LTHQDYQDMLAAQALNALDLNDSKLLEAHLESCPDCRSQLSNLQNTAACLAFAAIEGKPFKPAAEIRGRILQAIRPEVSPSANVTRLNQKRVRPWTTAQMWGAIAAGVFIVLSAWLFVLWRENRVVRGEMVRLRRQVQEMQVQRDRRQEAIALMTAPGTRMTELAGTGEMPGAHATLAFDKNGRAILMAKGLPPPPEGKAYQLWFIAGGRAMPGKVFVTDSSGAGMLNDQIPAVALNAAVFAVTLEPQSGVTQPTGAMYLKSLS